MSIRILTDSASDLLPPYRSELTVLPMCITFGEDEYLDGVDLTHREFYEKLIASKDLPTTSQISPAQFGEAFQKAVDAGETVIAIVLSSRLSGTWQSACVAAEDFPGRVFVVDSANATIGERILVERALELLDQGLDAADIAARLEAEKKDIRLVALVDTLEYLKKGGRVSSAVAMVGGLLSIKPVVGVVDGEVVMLGKSRGSKHGGNLLIQEIRKAGSIDYGRPYLVGYAGLDDTLLQQYIEDSRPIWSPHTDHLPVVTVGGTIGTHVGPGGIAVAFFRRSMTNA